VELFAEHLVDMEIVKRWLTKLNKWEYTWLCLMVIVTLAVHFAIIEQPKEIIFDENHYVKDARVILEKHTTERTEHPPLGKLMIVAGISLFGDNPVGWRFFPIVFGTASIVFFYLICRQLKMSRMAASIATFLLALDNMSFVQASVAMLDVFSVTFMLLSFWLYLRRSYPLSAVAVALATLAKLTGVFALLPILLHWLIARRKKWVNFVASMALAPISFMLLLPAFDFIIYRRLPDFITGIKTMLSKTASLTFANVTHPALSRPWEWLIFPSKAIMAYWYQPHYISAVSFTIWALIIPTVIYMTVKAVKKNDAGLFGVLWFAGTYLVWIPLSLITNRVSFVFYFYPTVGAICLGLGMGLSQLIDFWRTRPTGKLRWAAISGVVVFLLLHLAIFIVLTPINNWPIEKLAQ
jgi:predicted membrane-bound dolichyl-phosphate-mannose-protein mannosyltransferase